MSPKVGLLTSRLSPSPSPSAMARTKCVFPAPSGPTRAMTVPGKSAEPSRWPSAVVAARSGRSRCMERTGARQRLLFPVVLVQLLGLLAQIRFEEHVDFTVEDGVNLWRLDVEAHILDERVRL